jgi:cephalosporin hydroxylase
MEENLDIDFRSLLSLMQKRIMSETTYFGIKTLKNPIDSWIYQEIIYEVRPDVIIEIGNANGGSALFFAHLCDNIGNGRVVGIDTCQKNIPDSVRRHDRIQFIEGDACAQYSEVASLIESGETVLVIEDSAHTYSNTYDVLCTYGPLVTVGSYFIVEDGICHHGLDVGPQPGPYEAVCDFVEKNSDFYADRSREGFFITWNPKGFLKRIK